MGLDKVIICASPANQDFHFTALLQMLLLQSVRQISRVPPTLAMDGIAPSESGLLGIHTPSDRHTNATACLLDPLCRVHAMSVHIPERGPPEQPLCIFSALF